MRRVVAAALLASVASLSLLAPERATAAPDPPQAIWVDGGAESWRADPHFTLSWDNPAADPPIAALHYRLSRPDGTMVSEERIPGAPQTLAVRVPSSPRGIYEVALWLENGAGAQGPAVSTQLRFDDLRPGRAVPAAPPSWLGRSAFPLTIRVDHPAGTLPVSGIRGYAISIDRDPEGAPCADPDLCTSRETDLQSGIGGDELEIPLLPEGVTYVHSLAVSGSWVHSAEVGHRLFRVDLSDPVMTIEGLPAGWTNRSVELTAQATDAASGMEAGDAFTAIRIDDAAPIRLPGERVSATVIGEGVHSVAYYARDAAGNVNDGAPANGVVNAPPAIATVRIDRTPPRVAFSNSQSPEDPELVQARVEDALSGPSTVAGSIGVRRAGSGDPYLPLPTMPSPSGLRAHWESAAYAQGDYEFRAVAYDAAGNSATTTSRADGGRMVLSNPLQATTLLSAGLGARGRSARLVRYGRRVRLRGRLTTGARRPIEGADVRVSEHYAGRREARAVTLVTGPGGEFELALPPGPSREVLVSYRGGVAFASSAAAPLRLLVRSGVLLRASRRVATVGGAPVVFRGKVRAQRGDLRRGGKAVELEFRAAGLPWEEFRTVRTNRHGRFRYAYRFSDDDSRGVRFQFRAHVAAEDGWPYEPGSSRPVAVRGR